MGICCSTIDRKEDVEMDDLFNWLSFPFLFLQNLAVFEGGTAIILCPTLT